MTVPKNRAGLPSKIDAQKVAGVRFRELGGRYLLTNDWGNYATLSGGDFRRYLEGNSGPDDAVGRDLKPGVYPRPVGYVAAGA